MSSTEWRPTVSSAATPLPAPLLPTITSNRLSPTISISCCRSTRLQLREKPISLKPVYSYLKKKGYGEHREEGIVIEGWPVQFPPVASQLDVEALAQAGDVNIEINKVEGSVRTRILRPEHIVANALRVGRPQDFIRVTQFLQEHAVDLTILCALLDRHGLKHEWQSFCKRAGIDDPCRLDTSQ